MFLLVPVVVTMTFVAVICIMDMYGGDFFIGESIKWSFLFLCVLLCEVLWKHFAFSCVFGVCSTPLCNICSGYVQELLITHGTYGKAG